MQRAVSGRELRVSDYVLPTYTFTLTYEVLRDKWDTRGGAGRGFGLFPPASTPHDELRTIWNFFNQQRGASIPFQFNDPTDNTTRSDPAVAQTVYFGTGDGVTTHFQLASALMAPVIHTFINSYTPSGPAHVDLDTGVLIYDSAPGVGVQVGADMNYNYKVRFAADNLEAENFMYQLWAMKQLKLVSVIY
jgi:uncharacterized protein (TIGR02217 family)